MKNQKKLSIKALMRQTYSDVLTEFVIFGSPATNKNSKVPTKGGHLIGSKYATDYTNIFAKQIERYKSKIEGIPFDDPSNMWIFECYYNNVNADVSLDLVFDLLEYHGLVTNDKTLRNYLVIGEHFDMELPRIEFTILRAKNE